MGTNVLPCVTHRDEVVLTRLRIGHTLLTHFFKLKSQPPAEYALCHCPLTVNHLLFECVDTALARDYLYKLTTIKEVFNDISFETLLDFMTEVQLFDKI